MSCGLYCPGCSFGHTKLGAPTAQPAVTIYKQLQSTALDEKQVVHYSELTPHGQYRKKSQAAWSHQSPDPHQRGKTKELTDHLPESLSRKNF